MQRWTAYDGANPYADFDGANALTNRYLHGPAVDFLLSRTNSAGTTAWYLPDRLGSVRQVADTAGSLTYTATYDSFGQVLSESGTGGDRFKYTGREYEAGAAIYDYRARPYGPATGRFLRRDPIGFLGGDANLYRYVGNAPTNFVDPSGLAGERRWGQTVSEWGAWAGDFAGALPGAVGETFLSGEAIDSVIGYQAGLWDHTVAPVGSLFGRDWTSAARPIYGNEAAYRGGHVVGDATGYAMDAATLGYGGVGRASLSLGTSAPRLSASSVGALEVVTSGGRVVVVPSGAVGVLGGANAAYHAMSAGPKGEARTSPDADDATRAKRAKGSSPRTDPGPMSQQRASQGGLNSGAAPNTVAPTARRPSVSASLPSRVTGELPAGQVRTSAEVTQARNFFKRNRDAARRWWEERTGRQWPSDATHYEHPRPLADGGDPLFVEPGFGGPNSPHMLPGPDGLTDFQRWGRRGGRPPQN